MPWGSDCILRLDLVVGDVRPRVEALALHGVQVGLLGGVQGVDDVGIEHGAVEADLAIQEVELPGGLLHRIQIEAGDPEGMSPSMRRRNACIKG